VEYEREGARMCFLRAPSTRAGVFTALSWILMSELLLCSFRDDRIDGQGTLKMSNSMRGAEEVCAAPHLCISCVWYVQGEILVPIELTRDIRMIHYKAGFNGEGN
jgi:hypothetical protein